MNVVITDGAKSLGVLPLGELRPFESGGEGYNANGKLTIDGREYRASINLTRSGSKNEPEAAQRAAQAIANKAAKSAARTGNVDAILASIPADKLAAALAARQPTKRK